MCIQIQKRGWQHEDNKPELGKSLEQETENKSQNGQWNERLAQVGAMRLMKSGKSKASPECQKAARGLAA